MDAQIGRFYEPPPRREKTMQYEADTLRKNYLMYRWLVGGRLPTLYLEHIEMFMLNPNRVEVLDPQTCARLQRMLTHMRQGKQGPYTIQDIENVNAQMPECPSGLRGRT